MTQARTPAGPAPPPLPPLLAARDLHAHYGGHHVLQGIDLDIAPGESLALLGRNGMGKTTTVRTLIGLKPASHGTILIDGRSATGLPPHRIARLGVALVPEGRGIFHNLTVQENLYVAARGGSGLGHRWDLDRVLALFPRLAERLDSPGTRLSGGEQQMLAIGRALMTNPRLLLLDEATEGLAPRVRGEIWSVIRTLKAEGVATVIVDKDLAQVLETCDRAAILVKGELAFSGRAAALAADRALQRRLLGV
ncbi:MAG: ABC transporter ATP-binding protein [Rhodospirillales bacterium]|nr:MAG: ABC transporter ATP-binding protein [Rhodospirillales bacterium]